MNSARHGFGVLEAVLVLRVHLQGELEWEEGPLPVVLPDGNVADASARATYFDDRAVDALYGYRPGCRRLHRRLESLALGDNWRVDATEIVQFRSHPKAQPVTLMALHCVAHGADPIPQLARLVRLKRADAELRVWLEENLQEFEAISPISDRAFSIVFAQPGTGGLGEPPVAVGGWDPRTSWLWALASASTSREFRPADIAPEQLMRHRFALSADWEAVVLRDGAAFLGTGEFSDGFLEFGRRFVSSIYLDSFLLGILQREALFSMADEVATIQDPSADLDEVASLEARASSFRNAFWWNHLTTHGTANQLLTALQEEHRLAELHQGIVDELRDYSRQAQLAANLASARIGERTNRLLAILAVFGIPLAIGQLAAALVTDTPRVALITVVSMLVSLVLLLLFPAARGLLRNARVSTREHD